MFNFFRADSTLQLVGGVSSAKRRNDAARVDPEKQDDEHIPSLADLIVEYVPSLSIDNTSYRPSYTVQNGDIQTIMAAVHKEKPMYFERVILAAQNGGTLALDFTAISPNVVPRKNAPIVIILPGLVGDSQCIYVTSAAKELAKADDGGYASYRVVILNSRGSTGNPLTSPHLTHAGSTDDVRTVVSYLEAEYPLARAIFGLGFSMGGGLLSNYLSEEGETCPLKAGFAVSTVWDLETCSRQIEDAHFLRRLVYSYSCGTRLASLVREHESIFRDAGSSGLEGLLSRRLVRMATFNDTFMAQLAGYRDTHEFAMNISPIFRVKGVRRPLVMLNAEDDPMFGGRNLDAIENAARDSEWLVLARTDKGGHVGYFQERKRGQMEQWYVHPVKEFFDAIMKVENL